MNINEIDDFMDRAYALDFMPRYSGVPTLHSESVASHSFYVSLYVMLLSDSYNFDLETALTYAVSHDLIELSTGDVLYTLKSKFPHVARELKEAESELLKTFPEKIQAAVRNIEDNPVEKLIVKLADTLQCAQYARSESNLGNSTDHLRSVLDATRSRVIELTEQLGEMNVRKQDS